MTFTLQVKQKKLFGKTKLDIPTLAHACGFAYGSDDEFFILKENQEKKETAVFYNPERIGRGIFFDGAEGENGFYEISYNIPTTRAEITDFVRLVKEIERRLGKVEMYCVEEERTFTSGELAENIENRMLDGIYSYERFMEEIRQYGIQQFDTDHVLIPPLNKESLERLADQLR